MKQIKILLLAIASFCCNLAYSQFDVSGPTSATQGSTQYTYTADPFYSFDLPPDFTNYTFDWWSTGTLYTDWYTTSESCGFSGASANFVFVTASSSFPYYRRVVLTFEPWWGVYEGWIDVTVS